jgi:hypothetical protein
MAASIPARIIQSAFISRKLARMEQADETMRRLLREQAIQIVRLEGRVRQLQAANERIRKALHETTQELRKARKLCHQ